MVNKDGDSTLSYTEKKKNFQIVLRQEVNNYCTGFSEAPYKGFAIDIWHLTGKNDLANVLVEDGIWIEACAEG